MVKNHLKRLVVPRSWTIKRKGITFTVKPSPGAHGIEMGISLAVVLRDILKVANTMRDVKRLLEKKEVLVDGKRRKEISFPVGLMDVLELKETGKQFRFILDKKGKLVPVKITADKAKIKPCKIIGKTKLKGGKNQLNLFDSRNITTEKDDYKVGGTVIIDLAEGKIKEYLALEKGVHVFLTSGKHMGDSGIVEDIRGDKVLYRNEEGELKETEKDYCFIVGKEKSVITLPKKD